MQIILKLTIPNKTIEELDEFSEKLGWGRDICWWDVVWGTIKQLRVVGEPKFMKVVSEKKRWWRLIGRRK